MAPSYGAAYTSSSLFEVLGVDQVLKGIFGLALPRSSVDVVVVEQGCCMGAKGSEERKGACAPRTEDAALVREFNTRRVLANVVKRDEAAGRVADGSGEWKNKRREALEGCIAEAEAAHG